jgi:transcriptional regulator with XRE-family HTH domain
MLRSDDPDQWDALVRELGIRLQRRRLQLGMSQEDVAYAAGLTRSHYQQLEKGRSRPATAANPSLRTLIALCGALDTTLADVIPGFDSRI